jgi:GDP-L-fucose synthase
VEDLAEACLFLMERYDKTETLNVGCGTDLTIKELALLIQEIVGHSGPLLWDSSKPDGTPQKLLDVARIHALGWRHSVDLREGVKLAYQDFKARYLR